MKYLLLYLTLLLFSCGGGGGEYYAPNVSINKINVIKQQASNSDMLALEKLSLERNSDRESKERIIRGDKYYYFSEFQFENKNFMLAIPIKNFITIIDSNEKIVKKLTTPKYTIEAKALSLRSKQNERYLSILVQQQTTSHSSTLYILDKNFTVVYKEHLLSAFWMAKKKSSSGDELIVSTENRWKPQLQENWIEVAGLNKYQIP